MKLMGLLVAVVLTVSTSAAMACSCMPPEPQTRAEIEAAGGKVLLGFVRSVEKTGGADINTGYLLYRIDVEKSVNLPGTRSIEVRSAPNSAMCGIDLPVGTIQILFIDASDRGYWINICGNLRRPQSEREARRWWRDFETGGVLPPRR